MLVRSLLPSLVACMLPVATALAMSSGPNQPPPAPPGPLGLTGSGNAPLTPRQEAEQVYALAYEEVGKAKRDLEDGRAKNAEKKLQRALERCERAVQLDERYHEAWNLLGYTARKVGDYDRAFEAYERCLTIKPDYAPAREYLGEAWLERGNAKKAREQLVWLERLGAAQEVKSLRAVLDAFQAAHPDSAAAPPAAQPARADSAAAGGGP